MIPIPEIIHLEHWQRGEPQNFARLDIAYLRDSPIKVVKYYFMPCKFQTIIGGRMINGIVKKVVIVMSGNYNIQRLSELGYKHDKLLDLWYYDVTAHRYIFEYYRDKNELIISIGQKPGGGFLFYEITFEQISTWVKESVKRILF